MEYQAMYKCRMCGEVFGEQIMNEMIASAVTVRLCNEEWFYKNADTYGHRHVMHECKNGNIGFADFQGFKRCEE